MGIKIENVVEKSMKQNTEMYINYTEHKILNIENLTKQLDNYKFLVKCFHVVMNIPQIIS